MTDRPVEPTPGPEATDLPEGEPTAAPSPEGPASVTPRVRRPTRPRSRSRSPATPSPATTPGTAEERPSGDVDTEQDEVPP